MNSKRNLSVPLLLFRQLKFTILNKNEWKLDDPVALSRIIIEKIHSATTEAWDYFLILGKLRRGRCSMSGKPVWDPVAGVILSQDVRVRDATRWIFKILVSVCPNLNSWQVVHRPVVIGRFRACMRMHTRVWTFLSSSEVFPFFRSMC